MGSIDGGVLMSWRLSCPSCGHFGDVRNAHGVRGKVFACSCGLTVTALCFSDLKDKLDHLATQVHTARILLGKNT